MIVEWQSLILTKSFFKIFLRLNEFCQKYQRKRRNGETVDKPFQISNSKCREINFRFKRIRYVDVITYLKMLILFYLHIFNDKLQVIYFNYILYMFEIFLLTLNFVVSILIVLWKLIGVNCEFLGVFEIYNWIF